MRRSFFLTLTALILNISLCLPSMAAQSEDVIHLYIDADRTGTRASGIAIEQGIRVALHEVDNKLGSRKIKLIIRDHHGSSVRSKKHLEEYLNDNNALVVFSGLHSPPLLDNLSFINENQVLVLDPWAAAGPITRHPSGDNWIFRLSIDDTKAGIVIVENSLAEGFKKPYLLLEETGWGKSNYNTMTKTLERHNLSPVGTQWFNWNLGKTGAKIILRNIAKAGADSILLVANAPEGKTFSKAMLELSQAERLPIRSHWGITGGDFPQVIDASIRKQLDLKFLQTRFSFISSPATPLSRQVLATAKQLFPEIQTAADINAPTGFIHAYDLTRLLIAAVKQTPLTGDIKRDRKSLRVTMENLNHSVQGLIKTYTKPYGVFDKQHTDAHEALSIDDFVMAYYGDKNQIILVPKLK
ncbi:MAG: ABC transporter substrate-binding protein [Pseudomonadales bacterium]